MQSRTTPGGTNARCSSAAAPAQPDGLTQTANADGHSERHESDGAARERNERIPNVFRGPLRNEPRPNSAQHFCHRCQRIFPRAYELKRNFDECCENDKLLLCRHCPKTFKRQDRRSKHHVDEHPLCQDGRHCMRLGEHVQQNELAHQYLGCGLCVNALGVFYRNPQAYYEHHLRHILDGARRDDWRDATRLGSLLHQPGVVDVWSGFYDGQTSMRFLRWCVRVRPTFVHTLEGSPSATRDPVVHQTHAIQALWSHIAEFAHVESLPAAPSQNVFQSHNSTFRGGDDVPGEPVGTRHELSRESASKIEGGVYAVWVPGSNETYQRAARLGEPFNLGYYADMLDLDDFDPNAPPSRLRPTPTIDAIRGGHGTPSMRTFSTSHESTVATYGVTEPADDGNTGLSFVNPTMLQSLSTYPRHSSSHDEGSAAARNRGHLDAYRTYPARAFTAHIQGSGGQESWNDVEASGVGRCACSSHLLCPEHASAQLSDISNGTLTMQTGTQPFAPVVYPPPTFGAGNEEVWQHMGPHPPGTTDDVGGGQDREERSYNGDHNVYDDEDLYA